MRSTIVILLAALTVVHASPVPQNQQQQFDPQLLQAYLQQIQSQQASRQQSFPQLQQQQQLQQQLQQQQQQQQQQPQIFQTSQQIPQLQRQVAPQNLLGVQYSSAADVSKTSFDGYGIRYTF